MTTRDLGAGLAALRTPVTTTRQALGVVASPTTVNIAGVEQACLWCAGAYPVVGDTVLCSLIGATVVVVDVVSTTRPTVPTPAVRRSRFGTVKAVTSPTLTVTVDGVDYPGCPAITGTYTAGGKVLVEWPDGYPVPTVLGPSGANASAPVQPPPPPADDDENYKPPPPPPPVVSTKPKVSVHSAYTSATWDHQAGAWSGFHGRHVIQGTYGSRSYTGMWWYLDSIKAALVDRTVTKAEIWLPRRRQAGAWSTDLGLRVHTHVQRFKTGGMPVLTMAQTITLPPGAVGDWYELPLSVVSTLRAGGGLGITGGSYGGVVGVGSTSEYDPRSGAIRLTHTPTT